MRGMCAPERLLDIVENFTLFQELPGGLVKLSRGTTNTSV